MDVERIQKINNLAVDLEKQGLANSREEAIAQAEKIFNTGNNKEEAYNSIKEGTAPQAPVQQQSEISQDSMKQILEQNTKYLVKTIKEFEEKVSNMEREMRALKDQMNSQKIPTVSDLIAERQQEVEVTEATNVPDPEPTPVAEAPASVEAPTEPVQEEKKDSHPRSGNFNDTDVSIEKFFYYGNG